MAGVRLGAALRQIHGLFEDGDRRRLDRRPAPGSLSVAARRVGVRGAGDAARADGPGRLPRRPARLARSRGRVPGDLPGADPQGGHDPGARCRRRLAAPRRASRGRRGRPRSVAAGSSRAPVRRAGRRRDRRRGPRRRRLARHVARRGCRGCPNGSVSRSCFATWRARRTHRPPSS